MNKIFLGVCIVGLILASERSSASLLTLTEGSQFNLITRGDATLIGADSQGIIAIGEVVNIFRTP